MLKGGGSENMGIFKILFFGDGIDGIKDFVLEIVCCVGGNLCFFYIIGIGVGGIMDYCLWMVKKVLLCFFGEFNVKLFYVQFEVELLEVVNNIGIGFLGMGGCIMVLGVYVDYYFCYIIVLLVVINF